MALRRNVVSNLAGYLTSIVIAFIVAPVTIRALGNERYGIWALVAQLTGYYGLLDLGIRGAVSHYTARHLASEDPVKFRESLVGGFRLLAWLGVLVLLVGIMLTITFPILFKIGDVSLQEIRIALIVMTIVIAANLPMAALSGALVGAERLDILNGIEIGTRTLGGVGMYVAMEQGNGLIALAGIQACVAVSRWVLTYIFLRRAFGGLGLLSGSVSESTTRQYYSYGGRSTAINLSQNVIGQADLIVIGSFLGTGLVTIYSIGQTVLSYLTRASATVALSFTPRLTSISGLGDRAELRRVFFLGVRISSSLFMPVAAGVASFGGSFIGLWVGPEYVTGDIAHRSDIIMLLLLVGQVPMTLQNMSWQLLFATRNHGFLARINVLEAVLNLGLSIILVGPFGILGVALGTVIPMLFTHVFLLPRFVAKDYGISISEYVREGVGRPVLVGALLLAFGVILVSTWPPANWGQFLLEAVATGVVGISLLYFIVLRHEEQAQVINFALRSVRGGRK